MLNAQTKLPSDIDETPPKPAALKAAQFEVAALLILRRLCETGAVLAVVRDMPTAVIVRDDQIADTVRTATVENNIAQALALKGWIAISDPSAHIVRYAINGTGRDALRHLMAADENRAQGFREPSDADEAGPEDSDTETRYLVTDTPLLALARRKAPDDQPFLSRDLIRAGEQLREEFELAHFGDIDADDWQAALQTPTIPAMVPAVAAARDSVLAALDNLGPGLAEAALNCCCLLHGLEVIEKKMGWSARSGKVVLRLALQRLDQHHAATSGKCGPKIG